MSELREAGRSCLISSRALSPLLEYLRGLGVVPLAEPAVPVTAGELMIERYSSYLLVQRGVARSTVRNYVGVAREFFSWREMTAGGLCLERLDGAAVSEFVLQQAARSCVGSAKCMVTRLRALLRFLHVGGEIEHPLADGVPSVAGWRLAGLVKALDARSLARLLAGCDRRTRAGRRDFAIITCCRGWGCAPARSRHSSSVMSIGALASCSSMGRAVARSVCRCPSMSARRSRAGSSVDDRAANRRLCSCACAPRMSAFRLALSRSSFAAHRFGLDCRRWARIVCGTPPRPRCSAPAGA
jgi:hypothetical protein